VAAVTRSKKANAKKPADQKRSRALKLAVNAGAARSLALAAGTKVVVSVTVDGSHLVPYGVGWDGDLILDGLVSKQKEITMTAGHHVLSWFFNHKFETAWSHSVSVAVGGGAAQVVDQKSSAANNNPISGGTKVFDA
jgi:hypothetical protein